MLTNLTKNMLFENSQERQWELPSTLFCPFTQQTTHLQN